MPKVIRVDEESQESCETTQWAYENKYGDIEFVELIEGTKQIAIRDSSFIEVEILHEDIPKLILALQAAHKHITNS
jgi:hypothetical protein